MKRRTGFSTLALIGLAIPSIALGDEAPRVFGDGGLPAFLKQFDVKGNPDGTPDGILDEEERQAMREALAGKREDRRLQWDLDGDGVLSPEEIAAAREQVRQRIEDRRIDHFLKAAGEDGLLSLEEFLALPPFRDRSPAIPTSMFIIMDRDGDGLVSQDEFIARLRPPLPQMPPFQEMDQNADGKVSLEEFLAAAAMRGIPEAAAKEMFAHLDRDKDGALTRSDFPELAPPPPPPPVLPSFRIADMNRDGRVSHDEFMAAARSVGMSKITAQDLFKALDRNRDLVLGPLEYEAAF